MTQKPTDSPQSLRQMLNQALQAYELAQATRWQAERQAQAEHERRRQTLEKQHRAEKQALEAEREQETALATAEQERLGHLQAAIEQVEGAARRLLEKAGLAHILGAPLRPGDSPSPSRQDPQAVTAAFADAQLAYVNLRTALLRLAQTYTDAGEYAAARRVLAPLLEDTAAPLYSDARTLLCESHYRPGTAALEAGEWDAARDDLQAVLRADPSYRDAAELLRQAYLRPAAQALEAGRWDEARAHLQPWLKAHKDDPDARTLLCESHYRPGTAALEAGEWDAARDDLQAVLQADPSYRDAAELLRQAYLRPAAQALEAGRWDEARAHLQPWLKAHQNDRDAHTLLCESHYRPAVLALQEEQIPEVGKLLRSLWALDRSYRDTREWLSRYPALAWYSGAVKVWWQTEHYTPVSDLCFSPDGRLLASANCKRNDMSREYWGKVAIYDAETGYMYHVLRYRDYISRYREYAAERVYFSKDGKKLITEIEGDFEVWDAETGESIDEIDESPPKEVKKSIPRNLSSDKRLKAIVLPNGSVGIIEVGSEQVVYEIPSILVTCVAFSPHRYLLAVGTEDGTVQVWGPQA